MELPTYFNAEKSNRKHSLIIDKCAIGRKVSWNWKTSCWVGCEILIECKGHEGHDEPNQDIRRCKRGAEEVKVGEEMGEEEGESGSCWKTVLLARLSSFFLSIFKVSSAVLILMVNIILRAVILRCPRFRMQRFHMFITSLAMADILVASWSSHSRSRCGLLAPPSARCSPAYRRSALLHPSSTFYAFSFRLKSIQSRLWQADTSSYRCQSSTAGN